MAALFVLELVRRVVAAPPPIVAALAIGLLLAQPFLTLRLAAEFGAHRLTAARANEHTTPITVRPRGDVYELIDGRHRAVASMMAGRKQVLAEVQD